MTSIKGLNDTWVKVCQYMDKFGPSLLGGKEWATRYTLVDPILRALGWEVENPEYVRIECSQESGGRPDYTCLKNGNPVLYVEAKSWGTISSIKKLNSPFSSDEIKQLRNYCKSNSVNIGALTDGGAWYILDLSKGKTPKITLIDAAKAGKQEINQLLNISYKVL